MRFISSLLALVLAFGTVAPVAASNISVVQEKFQQNFISISGIAPGDTFHKVVRLFNPYAEDHTVRLHSVDVSGADSFFPLKDIHSAQTSIGKWVSDSDELVVPALESVGVALSITIPEYAPNGVYAGGLLLEDITEGDISMKMRIFFVVDGGEIANATVEADKEVTISRVHSEGAVEAPRVNRRNFTKLLKVMEPETPVFANENVSRRLEQLRIANEAPRVDSEYHDKLRKYEEAIRRRTFQRLPNSTQLFSVVDR